MDIGDWLDRSAIAHRTSADGKRQALATIAEIAASSRLAPLSLRVLAPTVLATGPAETVPPFHVPKPLVTATTRSFRF